MVFSTPGWALTKGDYGLPTPGRSTRNKKATAKSYKFLTNYKGLAVGWVQTERSLTATLKRRPIIQLRQLDYMCIEFAIMNEGVGGKEPH